MPWHCKATGGYVSNNPVTGYPDSDGEDNCKAIWNTLRPLGWTATACAGLLTCIALESGYNPWRWENNAIQTVAGVDLERYDPDNNINLCHGYGLVQWTPASYENVDYYNYHGQHANKYLKNPNSMYLSGYAPNYADQSGGTYDGAAQMRYLNSYGYVGQYSRSTLYPYYGNMCPYFSDFKSDTTHTPAELATVWVVNFERPSNPMGNIAVRNNLAPLLYQLITNTPPPSGIPVWLLMKWRNDNMKR